MLPDDQETKVRKLSPDKSPTRPAVDDTMDVINSSAFVVADVAFHDSSSHNSILLAANCAALNSMLPTNDQPVSNLTGEPIHSEASVIQCPQITSLPSLQPEPIQPATNGPIAELGRFHTIDASLTPPHTVVSDFSEEDEGSCSFPPEDEVCISHEVCYDWS